MSFENEEVVEARQSSNGNSCSPMIYCSGGNQRPKGRDEEEPLIDWTKSDELLDNGSNLNLAQQHGQSQTPPTTTTIVDNSAFYSVEKEPISDQISGKSNFGLLNYPKNCSPYSSAQQAPISPQVAPEVPIFQQQPQQQQMVSQPQQQQQPQQSPANPQTVGKRFNCGLKNLGNTCYINSCLQALFMTNSFRRYLFKHPNVGPLHSALSKLFYQMEKVGTRSVNQQEYIKPDEFTNEFRALKPQFVKHEQHDAQEFLSILLECIHQEANVGKRQTTLFEPKSADEAWIQHLNTVDNSYLAKLFVGQVESCLKCMTCGNESLSWCCFWQIPLHLSDLSQNSVYIDNKETGVHEQLLSVEGCVQDFTASEVLGDDCAPFCEKCHKRRTSSKQQTICRAPHYLIIHLKRFTHTGTKITRKVLINIILTMCQKQFVLYACVLHRGTETMGHYFTLYNMNISGNEWLLFDDDTIIRDITAQQAETMLQDYAYICFYKAFNRLPKQPVQPAPPVEMPPPVLLHPLPSPLQPELAAPLQFLGQQMNNNKENKEDNNTTTTSTPTTPTTIPQQHQQ